MGTPDRSREGDLVFVGDVHLDREDASLPAFLRFLDALEPTTRRLVLVGDLFNLWLGQRSLEQPHQTAVVSKLAQLRERGVSVVYLEGNRDYRIAGGYRGSALDEVSDRGFVERVAGRRVFAIHGTVRYATTQAAIRALFRTTVASLVAHPAVLRLVVRSRLDPSSPLGDDTRAEYEVTLANLTATLAATGVPHATAEERRQLRMRSDGLMAVIETLALGHIEGRYDDIEEVLDVLMGFARALGP